MASAPSEHPAAEEPTKIDAHPMATAPLEPPDVTARPPATPLDGQAAPVGDGHVPSVTTAPSLPPTEPPQVPPTGPQATQPGAGKKGRKGGPSFLRELPVLLLIAFLLALLIKTFLVQAFYIPSESMLPTLHIGDRVLVNKVVYHLHPPRRGDIIVFSDPHPTEVVHRGPVSAFLHWLTEGLGVQTDPTKDFIKRVVGLPGETVEFNHCHVIINGKPLGEPYATVGDCNSVYPPHRVPANSLFVMGDNRPNSNDSRVSLGFIPYDKVIGRAFVIIWPPSRVGWLHGF